MKKTRLIIIGIFVGLLIISTIIGLFKEQPQPKEPFTKEELAYVTRITTTTSDGKFEFAVLWKDIKGDDASVQVGKLIDNQRVVILEREDIWVKVKTEGGLIGWCSKDFVR